MPLSARDIAHANQASVVAVLRQTEAPFRQSLIDVQSVGMSRWRDHYSPSPRSGKSL